MRIALVCRVTTSHKPGGMPYVLEDRAAALVGLGHQVRVITTGKDGPLRTSFSKLTLGVPLSLGQDHVELVHTNSAPQAYSADFARCCLEECKKFEPAVVHLDSFDRCQPWWKDLPCPVFCTMHGFGPGAMQTDWNLHRDGKRPLPDLKQYSLLEERNALAAFAKVFAISRYEKFQLTSWYALKNARLLYNPIAPYFFDGASDTPLPGAPYLSAGLPSTSGNRNFDTAAKACHLAGVQHASVSSIPRRLMPETYDYSKGLILPTSWAQGYDLCVAESLARRRHVIVSEVGSYAWEGLDATGVHLVPQNDAGAVADVLNTLKHGFPLPAGLADRHRPEIHAQRWLEEVT